MNGFGGLAPAQSLAETSGDQRAASLAPSLRLERGRYVEIARKRLHIDRKQGDHWIFTNVETGEIAFYTELELLSFIAEGKLSKVPETRTGRIAPSALSPLAANPKYHLDNQRKHAYVRAVIEHPDGFRRSQPWLHKALGQIARERGEKPPAPTTVLRWVDLHDTYFETHGLAAYTSRHDLRGKSGSRMLDVQEKALEAGVESFLRGVPAPLAYARVRRFIEIFNAQNRSRIDFDEIPRKHRCEAGLIAAPSQASFYRRLNSVAPDIRDACRVGSSFSKKRYRTYTTTPVPDRPYEHVEVDWTKLDCLVIDDTGLVLGRPNLLIFRDRATCMVIGFSVTFDLPSFAAFIEGLRHAMYPKDTSSYRFIKNPYPCFGRICNLYVDNDLSFIGDQIRAAGQELGMSIVRLQPKQPWLKGGVERSFLSSIRSFVHSLPGTTKSNAVEKRDYETLGAAALTLSEINALFTWWICDVYHPGKVKGLGLLKGLGGVPLKAWQDKAPQYDQPLPPPSDLFLKLAGEHEFRTIQRNGVTWDHIVYESADLGRILRHPAHQMGGGRHGATKYKVVRDPYDLSSITIHNHHTGELYEIPATPAHQEYARGKTLHQHQVCVAYAQRELKRSINIEALTEAQDALRQFIESVKQSQSRKQVSRQMARFWKADEARRHRTSLDVVAPAGLGGDRPIDLSPAVDEQVVVNPQPAATDFPTGDILHEPVTSTEGDDDDLEEFEAKQKWDSSHE